MTLRIDLPPDRDPIVHVWGSMVPGIGPAAAAFSGAVYEHSTLPLREFEAARLRIAQLNGCRFCLDWRTERTGEPLVDDTFAAAVAAWRDSGDLSPRERLAAEYADHYATDHHGIDDDFWSRIRAEFTDAEIVELTMCLGMWLSFGRLNRILGLDEVCTLPSHRSGAAS